MTIANKLRCLLGRHSPQIITAKEVRYGEDRHFCIVFCQRCFKPLDILADPDKETKR